MTKLKRLASVCICAFLLLMPISVIVTAQESPKEIPDTIYSFEELDEWLKNNNRGGRVRLGADIEFSSRSYTLTPYNYLGDLITIETGPFQLIVTGHLKLSANIQIVGDGVRPVIEVQDGGVLALGTSNYDNMPLVTATETGGCALYLADGSAFEYGNGGATGHLSMFDIQATGDYASAVRSEIPLSLGCVFINASGKDSVGIRSTQQVTLSFCEISAAGPTVTAPAVTLDTCNVSSVPENTVKQISRRLTAITPSLTMAFPSGDDTPLTLDGRTMRTYFTFSAPGEEDITPTISAEYRLTEEIDIDRPGDYVYSFILPAPYDRFDFIEDIPMELEFTIYDNRIPWYYRTTYSEEERQVCVSYYYYTYLHDYEYRLVVWARQEDHEEWVDCTDMVEFSQNGGHLYVWFDDLNALPEPLQLVIEVFESGENGKRIGETYILYLDFDGVSAAGTVGGDRSGGDRDSDYREPLNSDTGDDLEDTGNNKNKDNPSGESVTGDNETNEPEISDSKIDMADISNHAASGRANHSSGSAAVTDTSDSAAPQEYSSDTTVAISGKRIYAYLNSNSQYTFICGDLRLTLSKTSIETLALSDDDILEITIHHSAPDTVSVYVSVNGILIWDDFAESAVLAVPWDIEDPKCTDESGNELACVHDKTAKTATVTIPRPGNYAFITGGIQDLQNNAGDADAVPAIVQPDISTLEQVDVSLQKIALITTAGILVTVILFLGIFLYLRRKKDNQHEKMHP